MSELSTLQETVEKLALRLESLESRDTRGKDSAQVQGHGGVQHRLFTSFIEAACGNDFESSPDEGESSTDQGQHRLLQAGVPPILHSNLESTYSSVSS